MSAPTLTFTPTHTDPPPTPPPLPPLQPEANLQSAQLDPSSQPSHPLAHPPIIPPPPPYLLFPSPLQPEANLQSAQPLLIQARASEFGAVYEVVARLEVTPFRNSQVRAAVTVYGHGVAGGVGGTWGGGMAGVHPLRNSQVRQCCLGEQQLRRRRRGMAHPSPAAIEGQSD